MQVSNHTTFVRILQLTSVVEETGEQIVKSYPIEVGGCEHIPDEVWNEIPPSKRWGLKAKPDAKLELAKLAASKAISLVIACEDPTAINAALALEDRKSVIAALQARAEELGADGGEASN